MRIALVILILGLASCWAVEELDDMTTSSLENDVLPEEVKDEDLTKEQRHLKETTAPSFEDIKKEMEKHGILKNALINGLHRTGKEPHEDPIAKKKAKILPPPGRPLCQSIPVHPIRVRMGFHAYMTIHNFRCVNRACYSCNRKLVGRCRKTYTYITVRVLTFGRVRNIFRWHWFWRSYRIPACCQCYQ